MITEPDPTGASHINLLWKQTIFLRVDYWVSMDRYQDLITLAMYPDTIVEVLELIIWSELYVNVFTDAWRNHSFLVILYFEERGTWG